jgi:steroid delta-isomerase-like uncharacterized protein
MQAIDIVSEYYAAFNRADYTAMLALVHDEIRHEPNQGTPRIGKVLFAEFMAKMESSYLEKLENIVLFQGSEPCRIAAEFVVHGKYLKAEAGMPEAVGQSYILPAGAFLEVIDGKVARVTTYYNLELWLSLVADHAH